MRQFLNQFCRNLNHLSDDDHATFHLQIRDAANAAFGKVKNPDVEDWLHTEDMHADMKAENPVQVQDYRCDTDRTMLGLLINFNESGRYMKQLEEFKKILEPSMASLQLSPVYTIETVQDMPWMGARSMLNVLGKELNRIGAVLVKEKVLKKEAVDRYLTATRDVEYYFGFGDKLLADSIAAAMGVFKDIYAYMSSYLNRARAKTSRRYEISRVMLQQLDRLMASM